MNYRLGLYGCRSDRARLLLPDLGFPCSVPPGQAAADAGGLNLGFKDQRLALEWIQKNVHYFGGDPKKVRTL